jgi:4,5-dihydroxyphthalate decarboxylase
MVLNLPISIMRYDITYPLFEGRVPIDGVRFQPVKTSSMVNRDITELREGRFGLWDLNVGYWLSAIEAGWQITALPVFPKRKSVLPLIFCRRDARLHSPKDLEGRRVGTRQYRTAVTLWANGLLQDRYAVDIRKIQWVAQIRNFFEPSDPRPDIECIGEKCSIAELLLSGDVDAIVSDISDLRLFERLEQNPNVVRLFPEYEEEDYRVYRDTGVYGPMHVVVMSRTLDQERPGLARKLFEAFNAAKTLSEQDIASDRAGFPIMYLRERAREQRKKWGDLMAYGIRSNRTMIDAFLRYSCTQGAVSSVLPYDRIFAPGTLDT